MLEAPSRPIPPPPPQDADNIESAMIHMEMLERSASLKSLLSKPTHSPNPTTDPTMRTAITTLHLPTCDSVEAMIDLKRRGRGVHSLGLLMNKLFRRGRVVGDEERIARKQAKALRRAVSLMDLSKEHQPPQVKEGGREYSYEAENIELSNLSSPLSPAMADISIEQQEQALHKVGPQEKKSHDSSMIQLEGLLEQLSVECSNDLTVKERFNSILDSPVQEGSLNVEVSDLIQKYKTLREFSLKENESSSIMSEFIKELNGIMDQSNKDESNIVLLEQVDFSAPVNDLLGPQSEDNNNVAPTTIMKRDLSGELLSLIKCPSRVLSEGNFHNDGIPLKGSKEEISTMVTSTNEEEDGLIDIESGLSEYPLFSEMIKKYRQCMLQGQTALRHSPAELSLLFTKLIRKEINLEQESLVDPKHLLLVPLNDTTIQQWIPPASTIRLGRKSAILKSQSLVVSRCHAEITHDGMGNYLFRDVGSSSGSFLNGQPLSQPNSISTWRVLQNGDLIQLGVDYLGQADGLGNIPAVHQCVQLMVLLGYPMKAVVPTERECSNITAIKGPSIHQTVISHDKIRKLCKMASQVPSKLAGNSVKLYLEMGDLIHAEGIGSAVFLCNDKLAYAALFNNYKDSWEITLTDQEGLQVFTLAILDNCSMVYGVSRGNVKVAHFTAFNKGKVFMEPIQTDDQPIKQIDQSLPDLNSIMGRSVATLQEIPSLTSQSVKPDIPAYTLTGSINDGGLLYLIQHPHPRTSPREQQFMGEALARLVKGGRGWFSGGRRGWMVELRMEELGVREEALILMGMLLSVLLQIEQQI